MRLIGHHHALAESRYNVVDAKQGAIDSCNAARHARARVTLRVRRFPDN
jgi:hypothetical protein